MAKAGFFVASPSASGRTRVASGSRVPPWPILAALKTRRTAPTAAAEDRPAGLSSTSHPSTLSPLRLLAIGNDVAPDRGIAQRLVDAARIIERGVGNEAAPRGAPQLDPLHHLAPPESGRPVERPPPPLDGA